MRDLQPEWLHGHWPPVLLFNFLVVSDCAVALFTSCAGGGLDRRQGRCGLAGRQHVSNAAAAATP